VPIKIRLKSVEFTALCILVVMILNSCVNPVDVGSFMEDEKVIEQIEKDREDNENKVRVKISADSDPGLQAGNAKITGLNPNKYYKVEELDENNNPIDTQFVKKNGTLDHNLAKIGKASGGEIIGLTNNVTYRVKSAQSFPNGTLKYFKLSDTSYKTAVSSNGTVTITETQTDYYLDLTPTLSVVKYYEVMKVSLSGTNMVWTEARTSAYKRNNTTAIPNPLPEFDNDIYFRRFNTSLNMGIYQFNTFYGSFNPSFLNDMCIIELPVSGTENDYVFVEYIVQDIIVNFMVLRVNRPSSETDVIIKPPLIPQDLYPVLKYGAITLTPGYFLTVPANSSTAIQITNYDAYSDKWYYMMNNGNFTQVTPYPAADRLSISTTPPFNNPGVYSITVTRNEIGKDYSTWFWLEVTPP